MDCIGAASIFIVIVVGGLVVWVLSHGDDS